MSRAVVVALVLLAACTNKADQRPIDREAAARLFDSVALASPPGMSDLSVDERGIVWAIPERDHEVLELDVSKQPPAIVHHPLQGVMPDLDTESIAWLGPGRFAIGVEGAHNPAVAVLFAELRGNDVVITATRALTAAELGLTLQVTHGIEALCGKDRELPATAEAVRTIDGKRWAPLLRMRGDTITVAKLWLTTTRGKISAMTCTIADDGTAQVLALERHFGVSRILKLTVPRDATEVTPVVDLDLWPVLHDNFNMEGIARLPDGRLITINDNQSSKVSGPTQLFLFHPR